MKKVLIGIFSILFLLNISYAQKQSASKTNRANKVSFGAVQASYSKAISGNVTSSSIYIPGTTMLIDFVLTFSTADYEYLDGLSLTFPTGMTPLAAGTSNPMTTPNGCSGKDLDLNPIAGQTISWGEVTLSTGCGALTQGTYPFSVSVQIDALVSGNQTISYFVLGDGDGALPHSFSGTISLTQASANDVGVTAINNAGFYLPQTVITPQATVRNFGTDAQTFDVSYTINDGASNIFSDTFNVVNLTAATSLPVTFANTWTALVGTYTVTVQTHLAGDANTANDTKTLNLTISTLNEAYTSNASDELYHIIDVASGTLTNIGTVGATPFPMAEEFNGQAIYRINNDMTIGTVGIDGSFNQLGTMTGVTGTPTGLAWDFVTETMYVLILNTSNLPQLCTLDMTTYALTLIGTGTVGMIIGIDFANDGYIYGPSLDPDNLYKIDPATGAVVSVGPIGIDLNYGQDVSFDVLTGNLYGVTVSNVSTDYKFGTYNLTTGQFTAISDLNGKQHATLVITNTPGSIKDDDVMMQSISPIASDCGLSASQDIEVRVRNVGLNSQTDIPIYYTVNGGTPVRDTIQGPLASATSVLHTFSVPVDLSAVGTYVIEACTELDNDEEPANDCKTITVINYAPHTIPFVESFEGSFPPSCWTMIDADGDGYNWEQRNIAGWSAQHGTGVAVSASWVDDGSATGLALTPDNYLITPALTITDATTNLSFWVAAQDVDYPAEKFSVLVSTTGKDIADFTNTIHTEVLNDTAFKNIILPLSTFNNETIYIAFRHWDCTDEFYMKIDNVVVDIAVGINEVSAHIVNIYPNPTNNVLNVNSSSIVRSYRVINAIGQIVDENIVETYMFSINTSTYKHGIYFIQLETEHGIANKRFIVAK